MSLKETVIKLMCVVVMLCCFMQTASADWYDDIKPNSTWVKIEGERFVADTFMGVPALYNEYDNSKYHCGEIIIRFYKEAYGLDIYPYTNDFPRSLTPGYKFVKTKTPKKGDIIFVSKEMRSATQDHWAIVKDYRDGYITLFEQNTIWQGKAGVERKLKCPSDSYYIFTPVSTGDAPPPVLRYAGTKPTTTKPATTKPEATKPAATEPTTAKPTKPATTKPVATKPAATEPSTVKPVQPSVTVPVATTAPVKGSVNSAQADLQAEASTVENMSEITVTEDMSVEVMNPVINALKAPETVQNTAEAEKVTVPETTTAPVETTEAESDNGESSNSGKIALAVGVCAVLGVAAALAVVVIKKKRK